MQSALTFAHLGSHSSLWRIFLALALLLSSASVALAGPREQAARIHDRLAGVPADEVTLTAMAATLPGNPTAAANIAMDNPNFYAVTLKNFAAPWTNRDQNPFVPLNDYVTLVMGMVRDNVPFNQILSANMLYHAPSVTPAASVSSNAHFEALEARMREPSFNQSELQQTTQTAVYGTPDAATAGAITTRAAAEAFFVAGTNRAMFRFTLMNHMCMDMEQVLDTSIAPDRIRQDVSRSPGGRQPRVHEQLHRLSRRHGSARSGVRVLQLRRDRGPNGLRLDRRASEVLQQRRDVSGWLRDAE
jgi:hypothetical protein